MAGANKTQHVKYLIVGAGVAGSMAAQAIRASDFDGSITVVGQEVVRPYHRPPLSKGFLRGGIEKKDFAVLPYRWFSDKRVRLLTGRRATTLDANRQSVGLDDGSTVQYDELLLCYGGMVAPLEVPGAGLPGLYYLRTLDDAETVITRAATALREGRVQPNGRGRAVVIGDGPLGAETAASLRSRGLWVDLVLRDERPWTRVLGETAGRWLTAVLDHGGVNVHASNAPSRLLGDGRVQRVELAGGETLQCDFAVAAVGMRVDRRLLANTSIPVATAIVCDAFGRAGADNGVSHVWAAGDCASIYDNRFGKGSVGGHWDFARASGAFVGENMARAAAGGPPRAWDEVPGAHSEVFGHQIFAWGSARLIDRRIVRGRASVESPDFAEIGVDAEGRVCHVLVVGLELEQGQLRKLVEHRASVEGREDELRDPNQPI